MKFILLKNENVNYLYIGLFTEMHIFVCNSNCSATYNRLCWGQSRPRKAFRFVLLVVLFWYNLIIYFHLLIFQSVMRYCVILTVKNITWEMLDFGIEDLKKHWIVTVNKEGHIVYKNESSGAETYNIRTFYVSIRNYVK